MRPLDAAKFWGTEFAEQKDHATYSIARETRFDLVSFNLFVVARVLRKGTPFRSSIVFLVKLDQLGGVILTNKCCR